MHRSDSTIRPATKEEIPAIEDLCAAAYAEYRDAVTPAVFAAYLRELRRLAVHWDEATVLVAESDGRLAGCVQFYRDAALGGLGLPREWARFAKLAVSPEVRGRGVGRCLVDACVHSAHRIGSPTIALHTASFMKAACRLYERMGFRRCTQYDVTASDILGVGGEARDVALIAYRLDLTPP